MANDDFYALTGRMPAGGRETDLLHLHEPRWMAEIREKAAGLTLTECLALLLVSVQEEDAQNSWILEIGWTPANAGCASSRHHLYRSEQEGLVDFEKANLVFPGEGKSFTYARLRSPLGVSRNLLAEEGVSDG